MTTYLLIKSAESNHVTSVAVYDGGIGMKYDFAESEAARINAAIDKAADVDAAIAAGMEAADERAAGGLVCGGSITKNLRLKS